MRLLYTANDGRLGWTSDLVGEQIPPYAILSHTWDGQEMTYKDLQNYRDKGDVDARLQSSYQKILFCATQAKRDSLDYFWVDTCCIDKANNTELSEAINSMFRWYQNARKCYVYLSDVENDTLEGEGQLAFKQSRWFTRGWTLQELLAPKSVEFFSSKQALLGDKESLKSILHEITKVPVQALSGSNLSEYSVSERFSWAENRQTTREEDRAYCLLGVFGVHLPLIYGEGRENGLDRLRDAVARKNNKGGTQSQEERLGQICTWLSAPDPYTNYYNAHRQRQAETGLWLLDSLKFTKWKQRAGSRLWLYGIPGCGKTILSSTVVEHLLQYCYSNTSTVTVYFYFDFNDARKQDPELMLRSLLRQLLQRSSTMAKCVDALSLSCNNGQRQPSLHVLLEMTLQVMQQFTHVYIILDALDECTQRLELMDILKTVASWQLDSMHLLITSRKERDIKSSLEGFLDKEHTICLQRHVVDKDIQQYVQQRLSNDKTLAKWNKDAVVRQEIEAALMHGAHGMFQWAVCQLDTLAKCRNRVMLRKSLATLPQTLDQTYNRILTTIRKEDCKYAIRILQWLTFSARPLSIEEIAEVVAIDTARNPAFDCNEVLEDPLEALNICSSLVTVTTNKVEGTLWSVQRIITLAHYSIQEYLVSDRIKQGEAKQYSMRELECHNTLAEGCLMYLTQFQQPMSIEVLAASGLARYAAEFWSSHLRKAGDETKGSLLAISLMSMDNPAYFNWIQLWDPDRLWKKPDTRKALESVATPLYYAALLDLCMITRLLLNRGANVNAQGGRYGNALQASSFKGHMAVMKVLLDNGADVNAQGGYYGNALYAASIQGHKQVVEMLLSRDAEVNTQGGYYGNAIYAASLGNHEQVVKLLSGRTANVKALYALTAKLVQVVPLPALLAISGETWILDKKVSSVETFGMMKTQLRTWLAQLRFTPDSQRVPVKEALELSVVILRLALAEEQNSISLEPGTHLGIYCAALVVWASTIAMNNWAARSQKESRQQHRHHSPSPPILNSTFQRNPLLHAHRQSAALAVYDAAVLPHAQIINNTLAFLSMIWPGGHNDTDPARYQIGCVNLLIWVELRLRGVPLEDQSSARDIRMSQRGKEVGTLLYDITGSIERLLVHPWSYLLVE